MAESQYAELSLICQRVENLNQNLGIFAFNLRPVVSQPWCLGNSNAAIVISCKHFVLFDGSSFLSSAVTHASEIWVQDPSPGKSLIVKG